MPDDPAIPSERNRGPIVLAGVCAGCILVGVGVIALLMFLAPHAGDVLFGGKLKTAMANAQSAQEFLDGLKDHQYAKAETLLTASAQVTSTEEILRKTEESLEGQFGKMSGNFDLVNADFKIAGDVNSERSATYRVHYERGTASVVLKFDPSLKNGKITGVSIEADPPGTGGAGNGSK